MLRTSALWNKLLREKRLSALSIRNCHSLKNKSLKLRQRRRTVSSTKRNSRGRRRICRTPKRMKSRKSMN